MQATKDTFYVTLRDRVAAANPARTVVVRGVTRPGVLVEENELPSGFVPADVFSLRWTEVTVDEAGAVPLVSLTCSIRYGTDGDAGVGGMDRGRLLAAMDAELAGALGAGAQGVGLRNVKKMDYRRLVGSSGTGTAGTLGTNVFWGDVAFGPAVMAGERLERVATVVVFGFVEARD